MSGQLFGDEGHIAFRKHLGTAFLEHNGKDVEEIHVTDKHIAYEVLLANVNQLVLQEMEMRHGFNLGQFAVENFFHAVAIKELFFIAHGINPLAVGVLARHGVLLHHVAKTDDDESQGYAQSDELNGGVELVAG